MIKSLMDRYKAAGCPAEFHVNEPGYAGVFRLDVDPPRFDGDYSPDEFDGPEDFQRFVTALANELRNAYRTERQEPTVGAAEALEAARLLEREYRAWLEGAEDITPERVIERAALAVNRLRGIGRDDLARRVIEVMQPPE
ncbi:MAG: hypothetical protein ACLFV4_12100 [Candidatus Hydrogenedentota bacterium]